MMAAKNGLGMLRAARPDLTHWTSQMLDDTERSLLLERIISTPLPPATSEATSSNRTPIERSNTPLTDRSHIRRWLVPAIAAACVPAILAVAIVGGRALLSNNDSSGNATNIGVGSDACSSADLVARRYYTQGQLSGAAADDPSQNDIYRFTLENVGSRLCVLTGYPTGFRASGKVLGKNYPDEIDSALTIAVQRGVPAHSGMPAQSIQLRPGDSAYFGFTEVKYSSTQKTRDVVELTGVTVPGDSHAISFQRSPADGAKNVPYTVTMIGATINTINVTPFTRTLP
jgi:hypothetical protein